MKIIFRIYLIVISFCVFSQENTLGLNLSGGLSINSNDKWEKQIEDRNLVETQNEKYTSYSLGLFYDRRVSDYMRFNIQLNYSVYGSSYSYSVAGVAVDGNLWKEVIEMPILLNVTSVNPKGLFLSIGPTIQCLLNMYKWEEESGDIVMDYSFDKTRYIQLMSHVGAGVAIETNKYSYKLEIFYNRDIAYIPFSDNLPNDMNSVMLMLSYGRRF